MSLELVRQLRYDHPYRYDGTKFGGPKLWTPSEITTTAWYDAYDEGTITHSGGSVSQWDDKSGNNYHATQGTGSEQPLTGTRQLNGVNVLDFDGGDSLQLPTALETYTSNLKWFCLAEVDSGLSALLYWSNSTSRIAGAEVNRAGTGVVEFRPGNTQVTVSASEAVPATIYEFVTGQGIYIDGNQEKVGQALAGATVSDAYIGSRAFADRINGAIAEVIIIDGSLSTGDRERIEGYLAHKWGLEANLPAGHPYKTNPPTV